MTLVDKVARVLMDFDDKPAECLIGDGYQMRARRLVEAMREPSSAMLDEANDFWIGQSVRPGTIRLGWLAMIDAALAEHKP